MKKIFYIFILVLISCNNPHENRNNSEKEAIKTTHKVSKVKKINKPSTVNPIKRVEDLKITYNPSKDPQNKGGFNLNIKRDVENVKDAEKKPFSIETLYKLKSISSVKISPDNKKILFVLTNYLLKKGESNNDIYLMNIDGSNQKQMTNHKSADYNPVWHPGSKKFMFLSTRKEGVQIWEMNIDGGEPFQLTHLSTGISHPVYSHDGEKIAFSSNIFPKFGADDLKNKNLLDKIKNNPIKAHYATHLLFRHWNYYKDGRRNHIFVLNKKDNKIIDLTPGNFESPAFGENSYVFSPDSKELAFVSNRESPDAQSWTTNKDIFIVPSNGGEIINITKSNKAYDGSPKYSPDGKFIAFRRQVKPGYESDRFRLAIYNRKKGETLVLTEGFDNWIYSYKWFKDSKSILYQAPVNGRYPLFKLDINKKTIAKIKEIPSVREFDLSKKGEIIFTFTKVGTPIELFSLIDGKIKKLTSFNSEISKVYDIRPAEEVWILGANGIKVHTFIVKPHGFKKGKKYPMIINVHGGPQMQWSDSLRGDWQVYPGSGYVVVFPNPHGSTGYGQKYTEGISKDWNGKIYKDIMLVTEYMEKQDYIDKDRMGAMGWSYGGYFMNWLLGHTTKFKALVSMMGVYDLQSMFGVTEELWFIEWDIGKTPWENSEVYRKLSPSAYADKFKTPTLIITGEKDYRVSYTQSLQLFTALRRRGVESDLIVFPNDGHWPNYVKSMPLYYASHLYWFHKYLGGEKPAWDIKTMVREGIK
jgi:dipeptidyl aminopeptidase/acylaminoacyl peptidase